MTREAARGYTVRMRFGKNAGATRRGDAMPRTAPPSALCLFLLLHAVTVQAADADAPKPASAATVEANQSVLRRLPFADRRDFEDASRGFIACDEPLTLAEGDARPFWNLEAFRSFIADGAEAPGSVNPSLWRNATLLMRAGLFEVVPGKIYQVRSYDLSNMTFVRGDSGWIVLDTLSSVQTARAAYALVSKHVAALPVVAVIYSHSHIDHYGGARGIVDEADVEAGKIQVIASPDFLRHAINENIIAGNAMGRRGIFMYGALLPRGPRGMVGAGLGPTTPLGDSSLIAPSRTIEKTGERLVVDGVEMVFQLTPGTEAPTEMNTYFPQFKALWLAENCTATLHNLYTLRGAVVRDGLKWAKYIDEAIALFGADAEVKFQSHHWPKWGNAAVLDYMAKQRDIYRYIHDQSVRLFNQGLTGPEIAESLNQSLPPSLADEWSTRPYYGTVKHNAKAVYQMYLGWFDGNPANLDPLPPEEAARKYVDYMGGADAVLERAASDLEKGEYRWVAETVKHVVFAQPDNRRARALLADAFEQLGYQAESGPWRNFYLHGAFELRHGVPPVKRSPASPDAMAAMPAEDLFDFMAVHVNGAAAAALGRLDIAVAVPGEGIVRILTLDNGVLHNYRATEHRRDATATLLAPKMELVNLINAPGTLEAALAKGVVEIEGRREDVLALFSVLEPFDLMFNIVTP